MLGWQGPWWQVAAAFLWGCLLLPGAWKEQQALQAAFLSCSGSSFNTNHAAKLNRKLQDTVCFTKSALPGWYVSWPLKIKQIKTQMPEEQMPAPELHQAAIPTKCFFGGCVDVCQGSSLRPQPNWGFLSWWGFPGSRGCPPNWSMLDNQAAPAHTGTACLQELHNIVWGARDLVPKGHPLPSHGDQEKVSFKWEANKLFSARPLSASKVPTCASRTYSGERNLSPPCQSAASIAFPLPVFQKMEFWCVQRKGFWGRNPPVFPKSLSCIVLGSNISVTPPTELSVSPALKGNGNL